LVWLHGPGLISPASGAVALLDGHSAILLFVVAGF